ncbi:hypothetical protein H9N25_11820 [Pedobacter riviphilus]|uniref:DUF4468 domain-containing protein n=1 Tax=Pedobacter riviphilus TaxID=2766984 RepID=A0ABX6TQ42_9SPHI|nr:hypothetical protein [Pedobacter riviphilus]QNR87012.1 hypothetical protein H9N25_11820 [Pedobacter riviphilus]
MRYTIILILLCSISFNAQSQADKYFKPASYYDLHGTKRSGLIAHHPLVKYITFKSNAASKKQKIKIDSVSSLLINEDSLVVLNYGREKLEKHYCSLIAVTPVRKFFCYYTVSYSTSSMMGHIGPSPSNNYTNTPTSTSFISGQMAIYIYQDGDTTYPLRRGNYKEILTEAFADFPELVKKIQDKEIKYNDIDVMFKQYNAYKKQKS